MICSHFSGESIGFRFRSSAMSLIHGVQMYFRLSKFAMMGPVGKTTMPTSSAHLLQITSIVRSGIVGAPFQGYLHRTPVSMSGIDLAQKPAAPTELPVNRLP